MDCCAVVASTTQTHCVDANTFELQKRLATILLSRDRWSRGDELKNYGAPSGSLKAILTLQDEPFRSAPRQTAASN
jgi:hypothetical protein